MKSILEELWYGNICPETDPKVNSPDMKVLMGTMAKCHTELMSTLTEEQKEIFEKFDDCWGEYVGLSEKVVFIYAFNESSQEYQKLRILARSISRAE